MKLQDKETGEIWTLINRNEGTSAVLWVTNGSQTQRIESIEELTSRFEDYEEPKSSALDVMILTITNFIENEPDEDKVDLDDCKQLLEKLKAWKRLKDKGFEFTGVTRLFDGDWNKITFNKDQDETWIENNKADLDLLFGGEE